jgi:hypothetical protein
MQKIVCFLGNIIFGGISEKYFVYLGYKNKIVMKGMMQDPKDKKAIMADAYSDKRVKELEMATKTPYQMEMASKKPEMVSRLKQVTETVKKEVKPSGMKLGSMKKKSFPDLNKDGKVTKADILKGRGVIK